MSYPTTAHTDTAAVRANLDAIRDRIGRDRLVLAAVKANGYGHGAVPLARMMQETGAADWLGVATTEEGIELREAGITLPILRFSPTRGVDETEAALTADLTLTVIDQESIEDAERAARRVRRRPAVHLKMDTGMRRIGVGPDDVAPLAAALAGSSRLRLEGVYSHLAVSDSPDGDTFTAHQIASFNAAVRDIERFTGPVPVKHLANSGGVLGHPDSWLDLVRPGIMIYGSYPDPGSARTVDLLPALRFSTRLSFLKLVQAGETIGYGRTWTAQSDTWIGTIPAGYGDGYSRLLSNRGRVLINGRAVPIVGRVCMDQTMIDLGPEPRAALGDEVTLIGRDGDLEITVAEIAELMGTIPYEVTCLITGRVTRTFS